MLNKWLLNRNSNSPGYKFAVTDISELCGVDDQILDYLAYEIVIAHAPPKIIQIEYNLLLEDLENANLEVLRDYVLENYVQEEVLPDKDNRPGSRSRVGNFGEILAAKFLVEFEDFWIPIYKLRFREKKIGQ